MSKLELAKALAQDYASRAAALNFNYENCYKNYYNRCLTRSESDLMQQYVREVSKV